jgi:hypothetical protein
MGDGRGFSGKLKDPKVRHDRGSRGGLSRTGADYHIRKLAESAGKLSAEQLDQLRQLLPNGDAA